MASVDGSKSQEMSSDESLQLYCNPCDYEGTKKESTFYCPQCQDYLCESCKLFHQKMSATRKHQVVSGNLMPTKFRSIKQEEAWARVQCYCGGREITIYCKDHDEAICDDCKALKHRSCSTVTIEEASAELETTVIDSTKQRINTIKENLEGLKRKRMDDTDILTAQTTECRAAVEKFKKELISQVEKITERSLEDVEKCDNEQSKNIEQHIHACSAALIKIDLDYRPFEKATASGQKPTIFIRNLQLKKTMGQLDTFLKEMKDEINIPNISFRFNETLKMTNVQSLGVVKFSPAKEPTTSDMDNKRVGIVIADMDIKSKTKVYVNFSSDHIVPGITGSQFVPNGELILCDYNNCSIKVLNADFTQKEQIKISSQPRDCCLMNPEEIVVSQPNAKSLLFVKVVPKLQIGSSVILDQTCRGVAVKDDLIYVSFDNGDVRVLDRKGQQQINVFNAFRFQWPQYIFITKTGVLYVSEYSGNNIRAIKDGKEVSNYKHVGLQYPTGLFIDGGENILVCEFNKQSLKIIDKSGQQVKVLLSSDDGVYCPYTGSFRSSDCTLIVGGYHSKLVVCKMIKRNTK